MIDQNNDYGWGAGAPHSGPGYADASGDGQGIRLGVGLRQTSDCSMMANGIVSGNGWDDCSGAGGGDGTGYGERTSRGRGCGRGCGGGDYGYTGRS